MFCSRRLNHKINKLHERALRLIYKDKSLTFKQLIEKENSFTIHQRNLQKLAIEMYKVKHNLCPKPFQHVFIIGCKLEEFPNENAMMNHKKSIMR